MEHKWIYNRMWASDRLQRTWGAVPVVSMRVVHDPKAHADEPLLEPLFNPTVQEILAATMPHPQREWCLSELAAHLGVPPSTLQRPLAKLTRAGMLVLRRDDCGRPYFRPDPNSPILAELYAMLGMTHT